MNVETAPLSHELFEEMRNHPMAELYYFPYTPAGLALFEHCAKSRREGGMRVVSSAEEIAGHTLHCMVCVPAARPSRKERGL